MIEWLGEWWPVLVLAWLVLTKLNRHCETSTRKKDEKAVWDAEEVVAATMLVVNREIKDERLRDTVLNEACHSVSQENQYRRALVDGVVHLLEEDPKKKFTPVTGEHPLDQLAGRAVEAEEARAKVVRGVKKAGVVALKIMKGALL